MHGICKPFQVNFHVLPFKTFNYFSFCATVFSSWGRSRRNCYLPYQIKYPSTRQLHLLVINFARELVRPLQSNFKKKKSTPPWYVNVGGHPMESVSHGLRKEKRWGGVPKLYKRVPMCQFFKELGIALTCLLWKIVRSHCQSLT
jgi:hypothetical protein